MALLAEELVEEYLNRNGYFTIRGIKVGVDEIDILATRALGDEARENVHYEVQASIRPISYISKLPKAEQRSGRASNTMKRSHDEVVRGVEEWVAKKYFSEKKQKIIHKLFGDQWRRVLVVNNVRFEEELDLIAGHGIEILQLSAIIRDMDRDEHVVKAASHADFADLLTLGLGGAE